MTYQTGFRIFRLRMSTRSSIFLMPFVLRFRRHGNSGEFPSFPCCSKKDRVG